jgi:hypothetical protein
MVELFSQRAIPSPAALGAPACEASPGRSIANPGKARPLEVKKLYWYSFTLGAPDNANRELFYFRGTRPKKRNQHLILRQLLYLIEGFWKCVLEVLFKIIGRVKHHGELCAAVFL